MGMKSTGGEIVQVQGGHIVRSTGRKDRHSKVYTAKGPRDRRVRLSAHTAIQFYDVQDRLGYDRPSKAVDWLIKKAKSAIDKLDELPPWNPIQNATEGFQEEEDNNNGLETSKMVIAAENSESSGYNLQQNHNHSGFIQSSIDNDAIAFFPTSSVGDSMNFQSYSSDIISRTNNSTQDLGLSLHSFQDNSGSNDQTLFSESNHVGFDANYHRIVNWNNDHHGTTTDMNMNMNMNRTGFMVNNSPASFLGQGSAFSAHRGTLQSSFSPSLRPWNDIPMADSSVDRHNQKSHQPIHHGSIFGSRFLSDALTGFCIPARIQGEDENHGVGSEQPSSSSNSHH